HAGRVDADQEVAVRLQVQRAGVGRGGDEVDGLRVLRIAHVDDGDAIAEAVADIGVAAMHHDLHAVAATALVAVTDELDVARRDSDHFELPPETFVARIERSEIRGGRPAFRSAQCGLQGSTELPPWCNYPAAY